MLFHLSTPPDLVYGMLKRQLPGTRLFTYFRPGYFSEPTPGRTVADAARDAMDLLDAWELQRVVMYGVSGGGPHALACAALHPDRVAGVVLDSSPAPFDEYPGNPFEGMLRLNQISTRAAMLGAETWMDVWRGALDIRSTPADPTGLIAEARDAIALEGLPYGQPAEMFLMVLKLLGEGWRDDSIALASAWGFALEDVRVPVHVLYGSDDQMVPLSHGAFLAATLRDAVGIPYEGGHAALNFANAEAVRAVRELGRALS